MVRIVSRVATGTLADQAAARDIGEIAVIVVDTVVDAIAVTVVVTVGATAVTVVDTTDGTAAIETVVDTAVAMIEIIAVTTAVTIAVTTATIAGIAATTAVGTTAVIGIDAMTIGIAATTMTEEPPLAPLVVVTRVVGGVAGTEITAAMMATKVAIVETIEATETAAAEMVATGDTE